MEQTEATKQAEGRFSFAGFALLVCFVRSFGLARNRSRFNICARRWNARRRSGKRILRRASNETLTS